MIDLQKLHDELSILNIEHHKNRTMLDVPFSIAQLDTMDRAILHNLNIMYPNTIIRMPGYDLKTSGIKGSIPSEI
jgi:hypothetical protein